MWIFGDGGREGDEATIRFIYLGFPFLFTAGGWLAGFGDARRVVLEWFLCVWVGC